jgi:hypothetical protein
MSFPTLQLQESKKNNIKQALSDHGEVVRKGMKGKNGIHLPMAKARRPDPGRQSPEMLMGRKIKDH